MSEINKIAILGTAGSLNDAPVADKDWKIWAITQIFKMHPDFRGTAMDDRVTWFEIHGRSKWGHKQLEDYYRWLENAAKNRFTVYVKECPEALEKVPSATLLPRDRILDFFSPWPYITCTCSWMLALAILELTEDFTLPDGRTIRYAKNEDATIGIWGIDMMVADKTMGQEYSYQRPSVEYYCGWVQGMGIKLIVPDECDILKCAYWYGDKDDNPYRNRVQKRMQDLEKGEKQIGQGLQQAAIKQAFFRGAKEILGWTLRAHMPGDEGDAAGIAPAQFSDQVKQPPKQQVQVDPETMNKVMKMLGQKKE